MFNCLRTKTFTSRADYDYWNDKNWLNSYYFYDVKINPLKKLFGVILRLIIDLVGKKLKSKMSY